MKVFTDKQLLNYADVMIWGMENNRASIGGKFEKGDIISLGFNLDATDLMEVVYGKLIEKGYHVSCDMMPTPSMDLSFFEGASEAQIKFLGPWRKNFYGKLHGRIILIAPASLTHLKNSDPDKIALSQMTGKPLKDLVFDRNEKGLLGWTLCIYPTMALAKQAHMGLRDYADEVAKACYLNQPNPVAQWIETTRKIKEIISKLDRLNDDIEYLHVTSKSMDFKVGLGKKRRWVAGDGCNIPSFEIFTSPDWRTLEGTFFANEPSLKSGNLVQGVRLVFEEGRVVDASAEKGEKTLLKQLDMDKGARQCGEFSLTDKDFSEIDKFMANTLFDENVGGENGNCHIAVGSSYTESYAGNPVDLTKKEKDSLGFNDSAQHWDLINTEPKEVVAHFKKRSYRVIYRNGRFGELS
ncbi:MAG: aminopeptidase [bacterium]